jgi:hypothetical protein
VYFVRPDVLQHGAGEFSRIFFRFDSMLI